MEQKRGIIKLGVMKLNTFKIGFVNFTKAFMKKNC